MTELQLLQKRIDAVYNALQYPYLSEWDYSVLEYSTKSIGQSVTER